MKPGESRVSFPVVFLGGANTKVEILLCVCSLGVRGVKDAWDSVSWKPRLLGQREEGWRVRTPGSLERRDGGVVCRIEYLHTPKPPQGPLVHLGFVLLSSAMRRTLTRESQIQKTLEPHGEELEPPSQTGTKPTRAQPETELPQIPINP